MLKNEGVVLVTEEMRCYEFGKMNTEELVHVKEGPAILRVNEDVSAFSFALVVSFFVLHPV